MDRQRGAWRGGVAHSCVDGVERPLDLLRWPEPLPRSSGIWTAKALARGGGGFSDGFSGGKC